MRNGSLSTLLNQKSEVLYPPQGWDRPEMGVLTIDELTRSNKELEQFAFLAAHDLQEPLNVACSYVQLLNKKYKGKLDEKADELISAILESNERMQSLIQGLLKYSQVGNGNIEFRKLDSSVLIEDAIENLKVTIEENLAKISYEDCPSINVDQIQLTQVFQNLINNAIKFRKKESAPCVHIDVRQENHQWLFSIQDNGIGIEPQYTQSIFGFLTRLHPQNEYAGNGIGLALCKRIVESHQGKIWVESQIGKGTTVYFTIPNGKERVL